MKSLQFFLISFLLFVSACGVNEADGQTEIKSSNKIGLQEKKNSAIHNESKKAEVVSD